MNTMDVLGIDVAKDTYVTTLLLRGEHKSHRTFPNTLVGFRQMTKWLARHKVTCVHACMEATGTYADALAEYLHAAGHRASVVNPAVIQAYGRSRLTRNKTDALDADLIARYCLKEQPPAWEPDPPEVRELQALVRRLEALRSTHTQELNRLQSGITSPMVLTSLRESLAFLEQQMHTLEALIRDHIDRHPEFKHQDELLQSIPGIGPVTSAHLLAIRLERFDDARAAAAYAGLNPALRQSGVFKGQSRLSKLGDAAIRAKLYLPALTAIRFNPLIAAQAQRLAERGKCSMVIISAAMHKLLRLAYGVLKSGRPFDPNYAHRLTTP